MRVIQRVKFVLDARREEIFSLDHSLGGRLLWGEAREDGERQEDVGSLSQLLSFSLLVSCVGRVSNVK